MVNKKIKHTVKASIFEDLFSDKNNLLELYKVLHPEDTTVTVNDLDDITLKNVVTDGRYNDLSFTVRKRKIFLTEAQSNWSVNILPRTLIYLVNSCKRDFISKKYNLYGSKKVDILEPELYVIYTGNKKINKEYISLSEEFFDGTDIIDQYISFCNIFDKNRNKYQNDSKKAIDKTINECIDNGILKEYLTQRKPEVMVIMHDIFTQEYATEAMRNDMLNQGINLGISQGIEQGIKQGLLKSLVESYQELGQTTETTIAAIIKKYGYSKEEAIKIVNKYWN